MSEFHAPLADMRFVIEALIGYDAIAALDGCAMVGPDLVSPILEEAARFATGVLAPLNAAGDRVGACIENGVVRTPPGFAQAYAAFTEAGWNGLAADPAFGGQGLPAVLAAPVEEMWHGANMAFGLCPLLTRGAIHALEVCASEDQKARYLPRLIAGTWTGTMNLTEPQAGSDLAAVQARAVPDPDGKGWRIHGTKIFITYGDHDMAENIVHLVLARLPDAPAGVKGISLFVVPKFLIDTDGNPGARNDLRCVSIEHKLGIHASPTAVMAYGDGPGALGELVGEPNRGLEAMFKMMNLARFSVGMEGVAIGERAFRQALAYAETRVQGSDVADPRGPRVAIIRHPDVRRMLMTMKAETEAARALAYVAAYQMDVAARHPDAAARAHAQGVADLLIPLVKGCGTEAALRTASLGVQVHGGMGFIEETGAAQHYRDARILTIYEGTTGIQANDLLGRKILRDGGAVARAVSADIAATAFALQDDAELAPIGAALGRAAVMLDQALDWVLATHPIDPRATAASAGPLLDLFGIVAGGWQMGRAALAATTRLRAGAHPDRGFLRAKLGTARFHADHILSRADGLAHTIRAGAAGTLALAEADFAR